MWQTDRRTDGIAMAYTRYSIYAVARNKMYNAHYELLYQKMALLNQAEPQLHFQIYYNQNMFTHLL